MTLSETEDYFQSKGIQLTGILKTILKSENYLYKTFMTEDYFIRIQLTFYKTSNPEDIIVAWRLSESPGPLWKGRLISSRISLPIKEAREMWVYLHNDGFDVQ
jgi:hypothetical protein